MYAVDAADAFVEAADALVDAVDALVDTMDDFKDALDTLVDAVDAVKIFKTRPRHPTITRLDMANFNSILRLNVASFM